MLGWWFFGCYFNRLHAECTYTFHITLGNQLPMTTYCILVTSKAKFYIHHKSDGWKNLDEVSSCILSRIRVGFMVDKVALGQLFRPAFQFYPVCIIPQMVTLIHSPTTNTPCSQKLPTSLNYTINIICTDNEHPKNVKNLHVSWCFSMPKQEQYGC